ncbi:MAG: hypothetical protein ACRDD1_00915, partial [Planctomycetia bacterium]
MTADEFDPRPDAVPPTDGKTPAPKTRPLGPLPPRLDQAAADEAAALEALLDDWWADQAASAAGKPQPPVPAEIRRAAAASPALERTIDDWTWLNEAAARLPKPKPSADFADRVFAAMRALPSADAA